MRRHPNLPPSLHAKFFTILQYLTVDDCKMASRLLLSVAVLARAIAGFSTSAGSCVSNAAAVG